MVKFTSRATGDLLMLSTDGKRLLMLIGKDVGPMGVILPEQMEAAERKLHCAAVQDEQLRRERPPPQPQHPEDGEPVTLHHRVLPLVKMMRSCREENLPIIWELLERR